MKEIEGGTDFQQATIYTYPIQLDVLLCQQTSPVTDVASSRAEGKAIEKSNIRLSFHLSCSMVFMVEIHSSAESSPSFKFHLNPIFTDRFNQKK